MNKKNKNLIFIITATVFLVVSIFTLNAAIPGTKHSQGNILITIDGYTMTLQEAVNGNYLKQGASSPTASLTTSVSAGHSADEIWVSVDGVESTLQDAINGAGLAGSTSVPYIGSINPGHLASEIEINVGGIPTTLQNAIDSGEFCEAFTYSWQFGTWGSCSVSCGDGKETLSDIRCERDDGQTVSDSFCDAGSKPASTRDCNLGDCPVCGSYAPDTRGAGSATSATFVTTNKETTLECKTWCETIPGTKWCETYCVGGGFRCRSYSKLERTEFDHDAGLWTCS